ncbi:MAG: thiamine phosphate synthase [Sulfurovum sp.]|nr:thiamine phosphate synthase [Sulfurovum sp.]
MIYALVDKETLLSKRVSLPALLHHIRSLNAPMLQYRNKTGSTEEKKTDLFMIRKYYRGILIVNDTIEFIDYADGLHVGQEDMRLYGEAPHEAIGQIRRQIGSKILGLSTHNKEEVLEANTLDLDYIGLGAYRATGTKKEAKVSGEALLEIAKYSKHPVGIIGGVRLEDAFEEPIVYKVIGSDLYKGLI